MMKARTESGWPNASYRPRATRAADAYSELRDAIMVGDLAPGSPLRLEDLAAALGMSISPVREAIKSLEAQGLAISAPYRGARVTELSDNEMSEIYEARKALERTAVRRAATRFDAEDRHKLEAALEMIQSGYDAEDALRAVRGNSAFHAGIAAASGSQWLLRLLSPLLELSERYAAAVLRHGQPAETREIEVAGHKAIIDALEARDPDLAEAALVQHLSVFSNLYSERFVQTRAV